MKYQPILGLNKLQLKIINVLNDIPKSITDISIEAKVPRTSILAHLKKFRNRQLVVTEKIGRRNFWKINDINKIEEALRSDLRRINNNYSNKRSKKIYHGEFAKINYYHGAKSLYEIWTRLSNLSPHTRIYGIQSDLSFNTAIKKGIPEISLKKFVEINNNIKKNSIIIEALVHEKSVDTLTKSIINKTDKKSAKDFLNSFQGRLADTAKLPDGFLDVNAEMFMAEETLYIVSWRELYAVEIKDYELAKLFKGLFDSLKHLCVRYDQGARMAQKIVSLSKD